MTSTQIERLESGVRAARRRGWLVGAGVVACWAVLRTLLAALEDGSLPDVLHFAADLLLVSSVAFGVRAYARALPSVGAIVWLRRFRADRSRSFGRLLERAALGVGRPLTLQDPTYAWSASHATVRAGLLVPVVLLVWLVGVFALALVAVVALHSDDAALVFLVVGWTVWLGWEVAELAKRAGFRTVSLAQAQQGLARTGSGGGRSPLLGVEVLKVRDEEWRDLVRRALVAAEVAVIDVSDANDHIREELVLALGTVGRDRIILAVERGPAADPDRIWADVVAPVQDVGALRPTPQWVRTTTFEYTPHRGYAWTGFRGDVARLRAMLTAATTAAARAA
jgi:hypothetical protein